MVEVFVCNCKIGNDGRHERNCSCRGLSAKQILNLNTFAKDLRVQSPSISLDEIKLAYSKQKKESSVTTKTTESSRLRQRTASDDAMAVSPSKLNQRQMGALPLTENLSIQTTFPEGSGKIAPGLAHLLQGTKSSDNRSRSRSEENFTLPNARPEKSSRIRSPITQTGTTNIPFSSGGGQNNAANLIADSEYPTLFKEDIALLESRKIHRESLGLRTSVYATLDAHQDRLTNLNTLGNQSTTEDQRASSQAVAIAFRNLVRRPLYREGVSSIYYCIIERESGHILVFIAGPYTIYIVIFAAEAYEHIVANLANVPGNAMVGNIPNVDIVLRAASFFNMPHASKFSDVMVLWRQEAALPVKPNSIEDRDVLSNKRLIYEEEVGYQQFYGKAIRDIMIDVYFCLEKDKNAVYEIFFGHPDDEPSLNPWNVIQFLMMFSKLRGRVIATFRRLVIAGEVVMMSGYAEDIVKYLRKHLQITMVNGVSRKLSNINLENAEPAECIAFAIIVSSDHRNTGGHVAPARHTHISTSTHPAVVAAIERKEDYASLRVKTNTDARAAAKAAKTAATAATAIPFPSIVARDAAAAAARTARTARLARAAAVAARAKMEYMIATDLLPNEVIDQIDGYCGNYQKTHILRILVFAHVPGGLSRCISLPFDTVLRSASVLLKEYALDKGINHWNSKFKKLNL